ncbi:MAG: secondary thiamine-phosphate synthase enzyme YjbQ [Candidatus Bipolaricaulota bacterium]|nr:secondary thiamine-phosphate synthase enzyme YjbQ [Candidatus Bipolaricaulota bacterium]
MREQAEIVLRTEAREEVLDITGKVEEALGDLGLTEGAVLLFCPHTTAALTVNETADPDVRSDVGRALAALVPDVPFRHREGNSPAHVRAALLGPSLLLPVSGGRLALGRWQGVYFLEFDGPRERRVWLVPLGGSACRPAGPSV